MTNKPNTRNGGIGHLAARSLLDEIARLRDDVHAQGIMLVDIDVALHALYNELRESNRRSRSLYFAPPAEE